jgi:hypothetical protein
MRLPSQKISGILLELKHLANQEKLCDTTASKPLPFQATIKRLSSSISTDPKRTFKVSTADLYALVLTLRGKNVDQENIDRVRKAFPILWDEE